MTRLIDADALLKELRKSCEYHAENSREFSLLQRDIIIVQEQPTIDAVPVIRCKDCKHCETMTIFGKTTLYSCTRKNPAVDVLPNDYCSRGRRIDES